MPNRIHCVTGKTLKWGTWDELSFIRQLAKGKSFLRDHRDCHNPRLAVRRYARLVLAGSRTYDPGIDFGQIYSALKKVLKQCQRGIKEE